MAFLSRLTALFRKRQLDSRIDEELRFHLEMQIEENIRRGMTPQEARRHARISSGGLEQAKEQHRDARGNVFIDSVFQDLRHSVRRLRQSPGFTAVAVLTLAFGLSVNATIFGLISAIFLRPLAVKDADRLVVVLQQHPNREMRSGMAWSDYRDYRTQIQEFDDVLALTFRPASVRIQDRPADRTWIEAVSGNYFSMLGITPLAGRFFLPGEGEKPNADPIAILGYDYWSTRLGGDLRLIGQQIAVNGHALTIVGIAPQKFSSVQFSLAPGVFVPATMTPQLYGDATILERRDSGTFKVLASLQPGVSVNQASHAVQALGQRLAQEYRPGSDVQVLVQPEKLTRPEPSVSRFLPFAAAVFAVLSLLVLFTSCANVANLMFARAAARKTEICTRLAIGAKRGRLIRQLLTESAVLALLAGLVGALMAQGAGILLTQMTLATGDVPVRPDQRWDWLPLVATLLVSIAAGVAAGLFPALRATKGDLVAAMRSGAAAGGRERRLFRSSLVFVQIAMSVAVLACGGLFVRSLYQLSAQDLGFRPERLLMASIDLDLQSYTPERGLRLFDQLRDKVEVLPGVETAAIAGRVPFDNYMTTRTASLTGVPDVEDDDALEAGVNFVDASYFDTLGITLIAGRGISELDDPSAPRVAVVNETFAERLWPGQDPIGKTYRWRKSGGDPVEVIGVARNGKYLLLGEAPRPFVYIPIAQEYSGMATLHVRATGQDPLALTPAIRESIRRLDADLPVFSVRSMDEHLRNSALAYLPLRVGAALAGSQGLIALFLAVLGVYGVVSSSIGQKTRDIGIRIALGADKIDIFHVIVRSGLRPALVGLALGLAISFGLARLLRALLYGLDPLSAPMFIGVFVFVLSVTLFACWLPARRSLKMDPMAALRHE